MSTPQTQTYFRKGFGLKSAIQDDLARDYHSELVVRLKEAGNVLEAGGLTIRLASEFGFCYGVDRAIDYSYETRKKFPDKRIFLVGEIIHNPGVNRRLEEMGVRFLTPDGLVEGDLAQLGADDVVIIPAFGVRTEQMDELRRIGCVTVDTTCGSVLNVWKRVERYARAGITSIIHGKHQHEETRATASRALAHDCHYLVVRNMEETELVVDFLQGRLAGEELKRRFAPACSPGFQPDVHLRRFGLANQTTMLCSESLAIAERLRRAYVEVFGEEAAEEGFRSFDTICSATQDRQDAVIELLSEGVDLTVVIGGYNSSNTGNLARICAESAPAYHVASSDCLDEDGRIRYLPAGEHDEVERESWLPDGAITVGVTAGASTPNSEVGAVVARILQLRGVCVDELVLAGSGE